MKNTNISVFVSTTFFVTLFLQCSLDGVKIELNEDGSGKAALTEIKYKMSDKAVDSGFSGFQKATQVSMTINQTELTFQDANKINAGGITMNLKKISDTTNIILDIPLDPNSPWSRTMNLHLKKYDEKEAKEFMDKMKKNSGDEDMMASAMLGGLQQSMTQIQFEISVPGNVVKQEIIQPPGKTEEWLKSKQNMPEKKKDGKNTITISMPLKDYVEKKYKKIVFKATYKKIIKKQEETNSEDAKPIPKNTEESEKEL
jgi:hypothetical protein